MSSTELPNSISKYKELHVYQFIVPNQILSTHFEWIENYDTFLISQKTGSYHQHSLDSQ